jgi:hypothetical protein
MFMLRMRELRANEIAPSKAVRHMTANRHKISFLLSITKIVNANPSPLLLLNVKPALYFCCRTKAREVPFSAGGEKEPPGRSPTNKSAIGHFRP